MKFRFGSKQQLKEILLSFKNQNTLPPTLVNLQNNSLINCPKYERVPFAYPLNNGYVYLIVFKMHFMYKSLSDTIQKRWNCLHLKFYWTWSLSVYSTCRRCNLPRIVFGHLYSVQRTLGTRFFIWCIKLMWLASLVNISIRFVFACQWIFLVRYIDTPYIPSE